MSIDTVKKWVTFTEIGASKSGITKVWAVTGKNGPDDGIGIVRWHGAWRKYVYESDQAFYDWDCLRLIAQFCEDETKAHIHRNRLARMRDLSQ